MEIPPVRVRRRCLAIIGRRCGDGAGAALVVLDLFHLGKIDRYHAAKLFIAEPPAVPDNGCCLDYGSAFQVQLMRVCGGYQQQECEEVQQ